MVDRMLCGECDPSHLHMEMMAENETNNNGNKLEAIVHSSMKGWIAYNCKHPLNPTPQ